MQEDVMLVPASEVERRVSALAERLRTTGTAAVLLAGNISKLYFSGTMQAGFVVIAANGAGRALIRKDVERAAREASLPVVPLGSNRELAEHLRELVGGPPSPLGAELDILPVAQWQRLQRLLPGVEWVDASAPLRAVRAVKSPWEVEQMRASAAVVCDMLTDAPQFLRIGDSELELAARVEYELRRRGHGGPTRMRGFNQELYYGHVLSGTAGSERSFLDAPGGGRGIGPAFPQGASAHKMRRGDPVMLDLVGNHHGYLSDQARTFFLASADDQLRSAVDESLRIHTAVCALAAPGVAPSRLYQEALDVAGAGPFAEHFMGQRTKVGFVGHGIGLEVDEHPVLARGFDEPLEAGMLFALEPKFTFEGRGVVGVEDTYLVTAEGVERITNAPQEALVVPG